MVGEKNKRLNIILPGNLYEKMEKVVKKEKEKYAEELNIVKNKKKIEKGKYIKTHTELIKKALNLILWDDTEKSKNVYILTKDIKKIIEILDILYEIKSFKNPNVKLELQKLYTTLIEENVKCNNDTEKIYINTLSITLKELIMLELSCRDIEILIKNKIIKEGVYYVK